ncbi:hypothetical protein DMENIID0001_166820 [Sergentomyia squamirostris]
MAVFRDFLKFVIFSIYFNIVLGEKCQLKNESDDTKVICKDVFSAKELAEEIQPTWKSVVLINSYGRSYTTSEQESLNLRFIEDLDLSQGGSLVTSNYGFRDLISLKRIDLSNTEISDLMGSWFNRGNLIERIKASKNSVTTLGKDNLKIFSNLVVLDVSDNEIDTIEKNTFINLEKLEELNLNNNRLMDLNLGEVVNLKSLQVMDNSLQELTSGIFERMSKLEILNVAQNFIKTIEPRSFEGLTNLRVLNISGNSIKRIISDMFNGLSRTRLVELDLSKNDIATIENNGFSELRFLRSLNISQNSLTTLSPEMFLGLRSLKKLLLNTNDIMNIQPRTFGTMPLLEILEISENSILNVGEEMFRQGLPRLRRLFLNKNNILTVQPRSFDLIPNLEYLSLAQNEIQALPPDIFQSVRQIRKLHLDHNQLEELLPEHLEDLTRLTSLLISHNKLTFIPEVNNTFSRLQQVALEGNPWQCPCLNELVQWLSARDLDYRRKVLFDGQRPVCVNLKKRKLLRNLKNAGKILGASLIFTLFLHEAFIYRFHPPFWVFCLLYILFSFIAFRSRFFKCFIVLLLPTLVSKRGRSAIIGYVLIITLSGSVVNIMKNVEEMVECLSCAQVHIKKIIQGIVRGLKRPFGDIKQMISRIQDHVFTAIKEIEARLRSIRDKIITITTSIRRAFAWLKNVSSVCEEKYGSPYEICLGTLDRMIEKCKKDFPTIGFLCNLHTVLNPLCLPMEIMGILCSAMKYMGDAALTAIEKVTKEFEEKIRKIFYFNMKFDSDFDFNTTTSKNWTQIREEISTELKKKTSIFTSLIGFMEILSLIIILWLFYKVFRYQTQYIKRDDYKNCYITSNFLEIEAINVKNGYDPVLPLRGDESDHYIDLKAFWLNRYERRKLLRSFPFLLLSNIQILTILATDYILHWILETIREYDEANMKPFHSGQTLIKVSGQGPLAGMYGNVVKEFEPVLKGFTADFRDCLPNPNPPDLNQFYLIFLLLVVCWIFLLLEPLSLRLQQVVMDRFHPERARKRAAWLHGEILRRRISFLSLTKQKILQANNGRTDQMGLFR